MNIGAIINPKARTYRTSSRVRKSLKEIARHMHVELLEDFADLPEIVARLAKNGCKYIITSGGDGTVQAILTTLAEHDAFQQQPSLILLPHGTTNMTAKDVSIKNLTQADKLFSHIKAGNDLSFVCEAIERHTLKIENPENDIPVHGMYFGWGAVHRAVLKTQGDVHGMGFTGDLGPALTLLGSWLTHLAGRSGNAPDRIVQGEDLTLIADGKICCDGQQLLLSVTTLERLIAGCRPFWNQTKDTLKVTLVSYPVQKPVKMLASVLYGNKQRKISQSGYDSFSARHLAFKISSDCILDGEVIVPPKDEALRLSLGPKFRFLKV